MWVNLRSLALLLIVSASSSVAEDVNCSDAMTQSEMNSCAYQSYLSADKALNAAYEDALSVAKSRDEYLREGDVPAVTLLREAQRAWIVFRDKACELESTIVRGGSMQPLIYSGCLESETRARTESLRYFAEVN